MTEINGLNERISELKILYQEAERLNLKDKAIELLVDINYLEELRELRKKQEPCEDAVSRAEVLNLVRFNAFHVKSQIKAIENMPSVTPQNPRKGHWVKEESPFGWDEHSYQCSECGRSIHLDTEMEDLEDYPYCHCGAKMQEVKE